MKHREGIWSHLDALLGYDRSVAERRTLDKLVARHVERRGEPLLRAKLVGYDDSHLILADKGTRIDLRVAVVEAEAIHIATTEQGRLVALAQCVCTAEIVLIDRTLVDKTTTAEDLNVDSLAVEQGVSKPAWGWAH